MPLCALSCWVKGNGMILLTPKHGPIPLLDTSCFLDTLGHAHRLQKSHITLHSDLYGFNTVMEGASEHSRHVRAFFRSHHFHQCIWPWMSLMLFVHMSFDHVSCLSTGNIALLCKVANLNHRCDCFFDTPAACSLTYAQNHHLKFDLVLSWYQTGFHIWDYGRFLH